MERNVLGKGLSALIPEGEVAKEKIQSVPVDKIFVSKYQPRNYFSEIRLQELTESIREKGVIQPVLVRPSGDQFELIAGERRFRAVKNLGYKEIPAIIKQVKDSDALEISLIENIQREELTKIEEARAYDRLAKEFGLTHEEISQKVAKDRTTVTNCLRLLDLPEKIQRFLEESTITMGHARSLLSLEDARTQERICNRIIKKGLSVRQAENTVRILLSGGDAKRKVRRQDVHIQAVEDALQKKLGTRVRVHQGKKRGKIVIDYYSAEDLNRVLSILNPESSGY